MVLLGAKREVMTFETSITVTEILAEFHMGMKSQKESKITEQSSHWFKQLVERSCKIMRWKSQRPREERNGGKDHKRFPS